MAWASVSLIPSLPESLTLSEPARSTRLPAAGLAGLGVDSLDLQHEDAVTATGPLIAESLGPGSILPGLLDH